MPVLSTDTRLIIHGYPCPPLIHAPSHTYTPGASVTDQEIFNKHARKFEVSRLFMFIL